MAMQDRLDDVLQARSLPDDLIAPGHLPAKRLRRLGLTISQSPFRKQADSEAPTDHIPDNGQVDRMNRNIKDATVKRYFL